MTIQALAWAIDQPIPGTAGRVLIALANQGHWRRRHTANFTMIRRN